MTPFRTKKISIIDPFVATPAAACFNRLADLTGAYCRYHAPHLLGVETFQNEECDATIVLGSASHVFEKLPWHTPLTEILLNRLERGIPVLGLCFGHQILCHAFGSEVSFYREDEFKLTGVRPVTLTQSIFGLPEGSQYTVAISHKQVVKRLGPELVSIGRGDLPELANDLVIHRKLPFFGSQPHLEASSRFANREAFVDDPNKLVKAQSDGAMLIMGFLRSHGIVAS